MSRMFQAPLAPRRRHARRLGLASAILPVALAAAALPGAAEAATLTTSGSTIQYQAASGETNGLRVFKDPTGSVVLDDVVAITESSASCAKLDATSVRCAIASPTIAALLGNQNDNVYTQNGVSMSVDAGSGDDSYLGGFAQGTSAVTFHGNIGRDVADYRHATAAVAVKKESFANDGRPGDRDNISSDVENLVGSRFADTLEGSDTLQFERYDGQAGDDTMNGRGGPDIFQSGTVADGADSIEGGSGASTDTMSYEERTARVDVTVNFFDDDDGQAGERDTIRGIETLLGGKAGDGLAANGGSLSPVTILGGLGIDRLSGTAAGDLLIGQQGADTIVAKGGDDTLGAADGELDTLFCGDGFDTANRDRAEREVLSCEAGSVQ
jgi:Ca2+-binding RTX toxin-like protein